MCTVLVGGFKLKEIFHKTMVLFEERGKGFTHALLT